MKIDRAALGPVRIAWAVADASAPEMDAAVRALSASQARRHAALDAPRGRRFATGRWLLTALVDETADTRGFRIESVCERCGGDHGRPRTEGAPYAVSVSYAGDLVVTAAVGLDSASAVGIDIESRSDDDAPMVELAGLFSQRTPPGLREWTAIEAVAKADGRGLQIPPDEIILEAHSAARILPGGRAARVPGIRDAFEVASAPGPPGHLISVAVAPPAPPE